MAGNVVVSVTDGVLNITGDGESNSIRIRQMVQTFSGEWPGVKLEITNTSNTGTINGVNNAVIVQAKNGVNIDLKFGDDKLLIGNLELEPGIVNRQRVALPGAQVSIKGGNGNDQLRIFAENHRLMTIDAGESRGTEATGSDSVFVRNSVLSKLNVTAATASSIALEKNVVKGAANIQGGASDDRVTIASTCIFDGPLSIESGAGNENRVLLFGQFNNITTVQTDGVFARLDLEADIRGAFTADLGAGRSGFVCNFGKSSTVININLGSEDDFAIVDSSQLAGINLDGGEGFDRITHLGRNPEGAESYSNFEEIQEA